MSDIEGSINITASAPKPVTCKLPKGGTVGRVVTENYCVESTGGKIQLQTKKGQQALLFGADALVKNPDNIHLVMPGAKGFVANNVYPGDLVLPERLVGPNGEVLCRKDVCDALRSKKDEPVSSPEPTPAPAVVPEPPKAETPVAKVSVEQVPNEPYENIENPKVVAPVTPFVDPVFNPFGSVKPAPVTEAPKAVEAPPATPAPVTQVPVESKAPPEPVITPAPTPKPDILTGGSGVDVPKLFAQAKELKPAPAVDNPIAKQESKPFFKGFGAFTESSLPSKIEPPKVVEPPVIPPTPKVEVSIEDKPILPSPPKSVETSPAPAHPLQYKLGSEPPSLKTGEPPTVEDFSLNPQPITPMRSIRDLIAEE